MFDTGCVHRAVEAQHVGDYPDQEGLTMAGRVFKTTNGTMWFEVRDGEFCTGMSWKDMALYMAHWENRPYFATTEKLSYLTATYGDMQEITDRC